MNNKEFYDNNGFLVLKNAVPHQIIDEYEKLWMSRVSENKDERGNLEGWGKKHDVYLDFPEIMNVLCHDSIANAFIDINKAVALHKNVTYFTSTEQGWHQDAAFTSVEAGENYQGVWVAIEDVDPSAGPFEVIPGSHKWDCDLDEIYITEVGKPGRTKENVSTHDFFENERVQRDASIFSFIAQKGDVIIWHGHLVHRGSMPTNRNITRKSLIGHYCNMFSNTSAKPEDREIFMQSNQVRKQMIEQHKDIFGVWGSGIYFKSPN